MNAQELGNNMLNKDFKRIYHHMSKDFQNQISLKDLTKIGKTFTKGIKELVLQSEVYLGNGATQYTWINETRTNGMLAVMDSDDVIHGLQLLPLEVYPKTDEVFTKTEFKFPFKGGWLVFWGGTNSLVNYHYEYEQQRYAYDFIVVKDGSLYEGDPALNESYFTFDQEYIVPADGTIVDVENDVKDNEPVGTFNEDYPAGNYVVIDHGNNEFSYLAHFKHQSIVVKQGDNVKQGDLLGLVGNSGNSSDPHIHFHVADSPDPVTSKSIRINFGDNSDVVQGDIVQ